MKSLNTTKENKNNVELDDIPNYRKFDITYHGATNHNNSRIKITEPKRYVDDKKEFVTLSYDYDIGDSAKQGLKYLLSIGLKPVARCSEFDKTTILCDNWADDFINLNGPKNEI